MRINIHAGVLSNVLEHAQRIADHKSTIPVLAHARLEAGTEALSVGATDLDVAVTVSLSCDGAYAAIEAGIILVPVKRVYDLVRSFPAEANCEIAGDAKTVRVQVGRCDLKFQALPSEDYPALPQPVGVTFMLPRRALLTLIAQTKFVAEAFSKSGSAYLSGALLELSSGQMVLVATDGKRLAKAVASAPAVTDQAAHRLFVSRKGLIELMAVMGTLSNDIADVKLTVGERHLFFEAGGSVVSTRQTDAQFPAYERVIPKLQDDLITVPRSALAAALQRVTLVHDSLSSLVCVTAASNGSLVLTAEGRAGDALERLECQGSGTLASAYNAKFLSDFLNAIDADQIILFQAGPTKPLLARQAADDSYLYVLMPMVR